MRVTGGPKSFSPFVLSLVLVLGAGTAAADPEEPPGDPNVAAPADPPAPLAPPPWLMPPPPADPLAPPPPPTE